jgi:hypothetical protein
LASHVDVVKPTAACKTLVLGLQDFTRPDLEALLDFMTSTLHEQMPEATRLIRFGDLLQAAAAIQNELRAVPGCGTGGPVSETVQAAPLESVFRRTDSGWSPQTERTFNRPSPPAPDGVGNAGIHGQFMTRSYRNDTGTRSYKLYVPSAYRGQPPPSHSAPASVSALLAVTN